MKSSMVIDLRGLGTTGVISRRHEGSEVARESIAFAHGHTESITARVEIAAGIRIGDLAVDQVLTPLCDRTADGRGSDFRGGLVFGYAVDGHCFPRRRRRFCPPRGGSFFQVTPSA
jgi:hypothetical protein